MSAVIAVTEEERAPLLRSSITGDGEEIVPSDGADGPKSNSANSDQRLVSLDVFRGLTVAMMILVDDAGGAFQSINHSPWFGVTIADFVMPFFLFGVGISISLVFKKFTNKPLATKKVILRSIKLFLLGLLLQGGYFHGRGHLTFGVDIREIRWLGVLQRISIGYLLASLSEIWLVNNIMVDSATAFVRKYYVQGMTAIMLCILYICSLYGLYVPDWEFESPNMKGSNYTTQILLLSFLSNESVIPFPDMQSSKSISKHCHQFKVHCGLRGNLSPPCNAVGLIDRIILGEHHLYQRPVYRRTRECSVNSPDYGPLPPNAPTWCLAPFDPEGILSSLMSAITCFLGLHFGHLLVHYKDNMQRLFLWSMTSVLLLIPGYVLDMFGIPLSKPLYTLSYMFVTAGASGLLLSVIFYMVDVKHIRKPMLLFQWMGMNALVVYALAACDLFPAALQGFYWHSPENNLVDGTELFLQTVLHSEKWGTLVFVMLEILFWGLVAGLLHIKSVYIKL